jgi:hypothetical protein
VTHNFIIKSCSESILQIIEKGFSKFNTNLVGQSLDEMPENSCAVSAGSTLESISRAIGNDVLTPMFSFIQGKISSANWGDRFIGMIAFGSIIEGPDPE